MTLDAVEGKSESLLPKDPKPMEKPSKNNPGKMKAE